MTESCCQFGEHGRLAGILTEPAASMPAKGASNRATVVLVSAGLIPKDGPFRLYTELARRLSDDGFSTLRFDLGGIGDSRQNYAGLPLRQRTLQEIRLAIDYLGERHGAHRIVLGGLCSGAEDAFRFAELDTRVVGVTMIDPFAYRTPGWLWRHLLHRSARRLRRVLRVYEPYPRSRITSPAIAEGGEPLVSYEYMSHDESSRILRTLLGRRVRLHFVYTGGKSETFNHEGQLGAMFRGVNFDGLVTLDHFPYMDHTQLLEAHRRHLVESIARRLIG